MYTYEWTAKHASVSSVSPAYRLFLYPGIKTELANFEIT